MASFEGWIATTMITISDYLMGRDKQYPNEYNWQLEQNAHVLLAKVNTLLEQLGIRDAKVSSGWRPLAVNKTIGGATGSYHLNCKAVDIADADRKIALTILSQPDFFLKNLGLWMEHPLSTPTWVHLDTGIRSERDRWIFKP